MDLLGKLRGILGSYETAGSIASGILAQPVSGLAGILAIPGGPEKAANAVRVTQNALTYQPRTESGRNALAALGEGLAPVTNALSRVQQATGDAGYAMGGPVGGMLGATLPDAAMMAIPMPFAKRVPERFPLPMQREAGAVNFTPMKKPTNDYQIAHKPMDDAGGAARLHDLTVAFGDDIYGKNALQYFGSGDPREKSILEILKKIKGDPNAEVTIYRGVPEGASGINPGDWVTLDPRVAADYGPNVVSVKVPASHVTSWADSLMEFGYFPPK